MPGPCVFLTENIVAIYLYDLVNICCTSFLCILLLLKAPLGISFENDFLLQLVDFESWKSIISRSEKNSGAISADGDVCVLPSSMEGRHLDVQGNIYAFGVLLLEIISGRPPYCKDKGCLVDWVSTRINFNRQISHIVDSAVCLKCMCILF